MAKSKTKDAVKGGKDAQVKTITSVKQGAVTKPSQSSKAKSKDIAKQVAVKSDKASKSEKKSKKVVKEPTPEPSSDSESESDEEGTSSGTSSPGSDSEAVPKQSKAKLNGAGKINGATKPNSKPTDDTSDSSASSEDEEEPKAPVSAPVVAVKTNADSEDDSEEDSEEESDEEEDAIPGAVDANVLNGKLEKIAASKEVSSDDDSESGASEDNLESNSDSSEDESEEEKAPPKKRKADTTSTPAAKKAKTESAPVNGDSEAVSNLYVGGISWNVDEEWLTSEFAKFGKVTSARLIIDRNTQKPKGFGYVDFANVEDAVKAQKEMHGAELDGRILKVDFSKPKTDYGASPYKERAKTYGDAPSAPSSTLFCANLSFDATEDTVGEEFGKHGNVLGVRLPTDMNTGQMKGYGYVEFATTEEASQVKDAMTGASIAGRAIRLDFSTPRSGGGDRGGRGDRGGGRGRGGFDRGGRGGGRGRGGFDRGGGRGGSRGGRGGSTNRGGFGDFQGRKTAF